MRARRRALGALSLVVLLSIGRAHGQQTAPPTLDAALKIACHLEAIRRPTPQPTWDDNGNRRDKLARAAGPFAAAGVLALAGGYRGVTFALIAVGVGSWVAFSLAVRKR